MIEATQNYQVTRELTGLEPGFQGHFPQFPIYPAVCQIDDVVRVARELAIPLPEAFVMERAKFRELIQAPCLLSIHLHWSRSPMSLSWQIIVEEKVKSEGVLLWTES